MQYHLRKRKQTDKQRNKSRAVQKQDKQATNLAKLRLLFRAKSYTKHCLRLTCVKIVILEQKLIATSLKPPGFPPALSATYTPNAVVELLQLRQYFCQDHGMCSVPGTMLTHILWSWPTSQWQSRWCFCPGNPSPTGLARCQWCCLMSRWRTGLQRDSQHLCDMAHLSPNKKEQFLTPFKYVNKAFSL